MTTQPSPSEKEIEEGNKLIREFMDHGGMSVRFQYDRDWQHLMSVVEKIESMKATSVHIQNNLCEIKPGFFRPKFFIQHLKETKIDSVWNCVVDFINWYNNQPKTK